MLTRAFAFVAALATLVCAVGARNAPAADPPDSITLDQPNPAFGDEVTFTTSVGKLSGNQYPMIELSCYQDVNGDGSIDTSLTGPDVVFVQLDKPDATFKLGGYSSPWIDRGGGPAICRADLAAYSGSKSEVQVLASVSFDAAG